MQKWLERCFADWVAVNALRWAQRRGMIENLAAGWEMSLSWRWPKMPEVQADTAQTAIAAAIKNGTTDYSQEIGPDWRNRFDALAEQIAYAREKGIPLAAMEMKSGGQSTSADAGRQDQTTDDTDKGKQP
jgi:hypothetical protein